MTGLSSPSIQPVELSEEEAALWTAFRATKSTEAREQLFAHYAGFAASVARRHMRDGARDVEYGDLRQLAFVGLLEALERFDPSQGAPFRSYAAHRISGSIRDGIRRVSEYREQLSWRRRVRRERLKSLSNKPTDHASTADALEELAEIAVGLALGFMLEDTGLIHKQDAAEGSSSSNGYESLAWKEVIEHLHAEICTLTSREQSILRLHYLEGVGFDQLASMFSITKGRVSQLHKAALGQLRKRLRQHGHFRLQR
jgi:RNA polymerase sigma factor for flagellar operon FliA